MNAAMRRVEHVLKAIRSPRAFAAFRCEAMHMLTKLRTLSCTEAGMDRAVSASKAFYNVTTAY